ncbi:MAG: VWA domain-containing protein [Caldilineaceae bacterium]
MDTHLNFLHCCHHHSLTIAAAQSSSVIVTHVSLNELAENSEADLNIFFTVIDPNGRPLIGVDVDAATIEVLGGQGEPTEAQVLKPNTPINVALLLDASGSMAPLIGDVREAAKSSLQNAPPNANFAVFKFSEVKLDEEFRPIQPFTNDRNLVASAIDAVQSDPNGPTCLYNALAQAIQVLEQQQRGPEERSAIIVFTDGKR